MERFFISIYNYFERHKGAMWVAAISSFLVLGFFASRIKIEEDITRILPHEKNLDKMQQVFEDSRFADQLTFTISRKDTGAAADPDMLTGFADTLTDVISAQLSPYIKSIQGKIEDSSAMNLMQGIQERLPIYLSATDYDTIAALTAPEQVKKQIAYDYNTLVSPAGMVLKQTIAGDPSGISWIGIKKLQQQKKNFELYDSYIITRDHKHLMIFVTPANPPNAVSKNKTFLKTLDHLLDSLQQIHPAIDASYYGAAAVYAGNQSQLVTDTILTQGVTLLLLIVFIGLYFRKKRAPVVIMMPVIFGGLFALALVYLLKGHISMVALGAGSIILGIAVNYSMHAFNHYKHIPDMRQVISDVASPMTIGSFTTIGGFLCLMLLPSPLLNDMGLFAALSLIGATLCSLIFLPHWIVDHKREHMATSHAPHHHHGWLDKIAEYHPERNKYLVGGIFLLTIVFLFTARNVSFESDMMRMNYTSPKLQESERKMNTAISYTAQMLYLSAEGKTLEEALESNERIAPEIHQLQQQGAIKEVTGIGDLLLSEKEQQARIGRWHNYWTTERKKELLANLRKESEAYHFKADAVDKFEALLNKTYTPVPPQDLDAMHTGMLSNFITDKHGRVSVITLLKVDPAQKTRVSKALGNQPGITLLDRQYVTNSLVNEINNEFNNIAWMTSLLVFMALLLSYGRIELTLITFIPMLISWVWILGIMGILGIKFNIVNIILSTFIFGLGDDYSIFIMDGLLQQYKTGKKHLSSFKSSIFLSAITTVLGLGILIFAKHPSLRSIAIISIVGIACVVLTSQVMIPFLFNWLITNRVKKGRPPWTLTSWAKSVFSLTYFALGSWIMTGIGIVLIRLNPFNKEKGKYLYHAILSKFTWSVLHIMTNVTKRYINPLNEDFSSPTVIISNHTSFLDILVSTSMNPKVILLTNQWVWRSPIFGGVVRLADYYPVADGVEGSVEKLREKVAQGYSIVVYPEGTRTQDAHIKRFHKGAFYLAEELGLDVLPVVIHGTAYTMTKGDFLLKDGLITVKYLPRIKVKDSTWGDGYAERTKNISRYFRDEYEKLRSEAETPSYFREQLYYNYLYKGPVLEWYQRIKIRLEKNYSQFHELLPMRGRILDIGCGYGLMSYMLHFLSKERQITGIDHDEEKVATANHAYLKTEALNFVCSDVVNYSFGEHDAFIISDLLHYLQPDEQETLIKKCISNLADGGVLIVRDGDADLKDRQKGTALTEFFSTKFIGFNKTSDKPLSFLSSTHLRAVVAACGGSVEQIDNTKYTSNVIFVIRKNPSPTYV